MARTKLTLQDVARTASDKNGGKGGRALQRLAETKGLTLSYATVDRILAGKYESTPQRPTIEALAVLAEMPIEKVYEAAGVPLPMAPFADQLPDGSDHLTVDQRRVVLDVIRGFIRDNDRMAALEYDLSLRPLHPAELLRAVREANFDTMDVADLDDLHTKLALTGGDDRAELDKAFIDATHALKEREHELLEDDHDAPAVEDPAQPDGVKEPDPIESARAKARREKWNRHRNAAFADREPAPTKADYERAAMAGTSDLEKDDADAAERGEESQDPEDEQ